jgi:endonuclease YncB( thermonuclease family)
VACGYAIIAAYAVAGLAVAALAQAPQASGPPPTAGITLEGATLTDVIDGDTVEVLVRFKLRIRMLDLDAPEASTPEGKKAAADLELHAESKPVTVWLKWPPGDTKDVGSSAWTFERWLGKVWLSGERQSLADWQRKRGNVKQVQ